MIQYENIGIYINILILIPNIQVSANSGPLLVFNPARKLLHEKNYN